ncbi:MAG: copper chaperone PCu(A)C [Chloroflexaceae bacterium]|nr:copper chaperone PCu(A)C [Chloroflexaceae bacterium]
MPRIYHFLYEEECIMEKYIQAGYGVVTALLVLLISACGSTPAAAPSGPAIEVSAPWVRPAVMTGMSDMAMEDGEMAEGETMEGEMAEGETMEGMSHGGGGNSAAYMTLVNTGSAADAVVGASTDVANIVELHTTEMDANGVMMMRPLEQIDIPANGEVALQPGGIHVMLIDLTQDLEEGDTVNLTLELQSGGTLEVEAPVTQR